MGSKTEITVHFKLCVSFFIVSTVVEHGQWKSEKIIVHIAVVMFQPFDTKSSFTAVRLPVSESTPDAVYAIITIGITISFAGNPSINAIKITPSSPIRRANGSRKSEHILRILASPTVIFAARYIIIPAGAATAAARPRTKSVLSNTDRTITLPICGFRYGGSSSVNDDGTPFKTVFDNINVDKNVKPIPASISAVKNSADVSDVSVFVCVPIKNIVIIEISVGNRPLHGTRLFVMTASSLSRSESIILHPTTPAALHPNPIHIVREI